MEWKTFDLSIYRRNNPFKFLSNLDNYDYIDYNRGGEELEDSFRRSLENTPSVDNDAYDEDEEDESLLTANKRSYYLVCFLG